MADDIITPVLSTDTCDFGWSDDAPFVLTADDLQHEGIVPTISNTSN